MTRVVDIYVHMCSSSSDLSLFTLHLGSVGGSGGGGGAGTNQPTNNAKTTRSGLFSPGARTSSITVDIPKPIAETTSVKDTPSTERQPNPPDHRHLWPILALRARRSSNLHLRMRPPPSTDLPVMQPRDTAYLSHLQEASHSNVNNNVKSSNMYIESCMNER